LLNYFSQQRGNQSRKRNGTDYLPNQHESMITISHSEFLGILFGCAVISMAFGMLLGIWAMGLALDYERRRSEKRSSKFLHNSQDQQP
jgi:uncharacterized protein (DUF2062 family)